jgi:glycosyltransferase involved in cell wall biosynthesis
MPQISVIIPCFNNGKYLRECLDSVLSQTFQDFEVIVVDDGSTDDTHSIVNSYGSKLKYLRQANQGPASARNAGIKLSQGDYIAFQDADDFWLSEKLELQYKFLREHHQYLWVYSDMSTFNDSQALQESWFSDRSTYEGRVFERLIDNNFIPTITVLIKKQALVEVGGFDENLRSCEDKDLWLRLALNNPLGRSNQILAKRRFHANNLVRDSRLLISSEIEVMKKLRKLIASSSIQRRLDSRIARLHFELGYFYFAKNQLPEAREQFRKSNTYPFFNLKSQLYYYSTYLDRRFIDWLRIFKNLGKTQLSN